MGKGFFRLLLRAYPRAFREEYGDEMQAAFAECIARERARRPGTAAVVAPLKAIADTLRYARTVCALPPANHGDHACHRSLRTSGSPHACS